MSQARRKMLVLVLLAPALVGCGATGGQDGRSTTASDPPPPSTRTQQAHPQAVEPTAGVRASAGGSRSRSRSGSGSGSGPGSGSGSGSGPGSGSAIVGDPNAHAPSLAEVKRELRRLNLCGGVTNTADAAPIATSTGPGFVPDPGTSQTQGALPLLTARLDALAKALGVTIYGISGYRTPSHSVAVGGFANDPHTKGLAEDIGVGGLLRSSAAQISEAQLAQYGLYRPFDPSDDPNNTEVNHIQLIPAGGVVPPPQSATRWDPDPTCQ